jgi:hypothetical protein
VAESSDTAALDEFVADELEAARRGELGPGADSAPADEAEPRLGVRDDGSAGA